MLFLHCVRQHDNLDAVAATDDDVLHELSHLLRSPFAYNLLVVGVCVNSVLVEALDNAQPVVVLLNVLVCTLQHEFLNLAEHFSVNSLGHLSNLVVHDADSHVALLRFHRANTDDACERNVASE